MRMDNNGHDFNNETGTGLRVFTSEEFGDVRT